MHNNRHPRSLGLNHLANLDTRIATLILGFVARIDDKSHVGDYTQQILFIAVIYIDSIVIVGSQQHFRTRSFTADLLLLVVGIFQKLAILHKQYLIQFWQIGRIESNRVFDKQYSLHTTINNIRFGIEFILHQLDDGDNQIGITVPAEYIIDSRTLLFINLAINLLRKTCQENNRQIGIQLLNLAREIKHIRLANIIHRQHEIEIRHRLQQLQSLRSRLHTRQRWRVTHIEFHILTIDLRLYMAIFLQDVTIVRTTHKQNLMNTVLHKTMRRIIIND